MHNYCCYMQLIRKLKKLTHILHVLWDWSFLNSSNLFWVYSNTVFFHAAQYRYFGDLHDALLRVDVQLGVAQGTLHNV